MIGRSAYKRMGEAARTLSSGLESKAAVPGSPHPRHFAAYPYPQSLSQAPVDRLLVPKVAQPVISGCAKLDLPYRKCENLEELERLVRQINERVGKNPQGLWDRRVTREEILGLVFRVILAAHEAGAPDYQEMMSLLSASYCLQASLPIDPTFKGACDAFCSDTRNLARAVAHVLSELHWLDRSSQERAAVLRAGCAMLLKTAEQHGLVPKDSSDGLLRFVDFPLFHATFNADLGEVHLSRKLLQSSGEAVDVKDPHGFALKMDLAPVMALVNLLHEFVHVKQYEDLAFLRGDRVGTQAQFVRSFMLNCSIGLQGSIWSGPLIQDINSSPILRALPHEREAWYASSRMLEAMHRIDAGPQRLRGQIENIWRMDPWFSREHLQFRSTRDSGELWDERGDLCVQLTSLRPSSD